MKAEESRYLRDIFEEYFPTRDSMKCQCGCGGYPINILSEDKQVDFSLYKGCPARIERKLSSQFQVFKKDLRYQEVIRPVALRRRQAREKERTAKAREQALAQETRKREEEAKRALERQLEQERTKRADPALSAPEAQRRGLATFLGPSCGKGHSRGRSARNGECVECRRIDKSIRSAMKRGAYPENLTDKEREEILLIYKRCRRISKKTGILHHVDHIVPLALGGRHHPSNLQILTAESNLKKGASAPAGFSQLSSLQKEDRATIIVRSVQAVRRWLSGRA